MTLSFTEQELRAVQTHLERGAREAGRILLKFYKKSHLQKTVKADDSPVTEADLAADRFLTPFLQSTIPGIPVMSEENDFIPDPDKHPVYFAHDPLDGTVEFIDRTDGWAIKVILMDHKVPVIGVVHAPIQGITYASHLGGPAERITSSGQRRIMTIREPQDRQSLKTLFNIKSNGPERYKGLKEIFSKRSVFISQRPSHTPGLPRNLRVAEGSGDLCIGRDGYLWDLAADDLILRNAGGDLFSLETGLPLVYDRPRTLMGPYVATNDLSLRTKLFPDPKKIDPVWTF